MAKSNEERSRLSGSVFEMARIGPKTKIRGQISGEGALLVSGEIKGGLRLKGDLYVEPGGSIDSSDGVIEAGNMQLAGLVTGDIHASGRVDLLATSSVQGNIVAEGFSMEEGASFVGRMDADFELPPELAAVGTAGPLQNRRR